MASELETDSINEVIDRLTTEEKISIVHGGAPNDDVTGYLPPVDRAGIPDIRVVDGPMGVRAGESTLFPASVGLAAAFDTDLAERFGRAIGAEARGKGFDVLLLPGCNLVRVPHCGRNFEYYSEDPQLNAAITSSTVQGIQSEDVVSCPKHYVANNQELYRNTGSSEVKERALRELYLPAFEAAVQDGDAGAIMSSYNMVNGTYAWRHEKLLTDVLKEEFDFEGPVMSDWFSVENGLAAAKDGLDLEMPGISLLQMNSWGSESMTYLHRIDERWPDRFFGIPDLLNILLTRQGDAGGFPTAVDGSYFERELPTALREGTFSEERLDDMVRRVLTIHGRVGVLDGDRPTSDITPADNRDIARELAIRGSVLLKNDDTLPLDPGASVAVIGPNADEAKLGGGGESMADHPVTVSSIEGIRKRANGRVVFERGHPPIESPSFYNHGFNFESFMTGGDPDPQPPDALPPAETADAAVVVVQDYSTEGEDRNSLSLPGEQDRLIRTVATAAEKTVVVLQTAGAVEMPWLDEVDAVLEAWYPGQEGGDAIAQVLYGDADPSGRLPVTFGVAEGDYPSNSKAQYPGIEGIEGYPESHYEEGVFVGYRHFDEQDIAPLFPFGHGLSYAEFAYQNLEIGGEGPTLTVSLTVENIADRKGREVVQVYVGETNPVVARPPRELVGFESVELSPGEQCTVEIELDERAFAYYDEDAGWTVDGGEYTLEAGRSSRDLRVSETVILG